MGKTHKNKTETSTKKPKDIKKQPWQDNKERSIYDKKAIKTLEDQTKAHTYTTGTRNFPRESDIGKDPK